MQLCSLWPDAYSPELILAPFDGLESSWVQLPCPLEPPDVSGEARVGPFQLIGRDSMWGERH